MQHSKCLIPHTFRVFFFLGGGEIFNAICRGCSGDLFRCGPRWMVEAGAVVLPARLLIGAVCEVRRFTVG